MKDSSSSFRYLKRLGCWVSSISNSSFACSSIILLLLSLLIHSTFATSICSLSLFFSVSVSAPGDNEKNPRPRKDVRGKKRKSRQVPLIFVAAEKKRSEAGKFVFFCFINLFTLFTCLFCLQELLHGKGKGEAIELFQVLIYLGRKKIKTYLPLYFIIL